MNLLRLLPANIQRAAERHPGFTRILENVSWLFLDKALRMVIAVLVGAWVARYLGPTQFGQLNYAVAFVSIFGALAGLGLNSIIVRDLVKDPGSADVVLGTGLFLLAIGGTLSCVVIYVCAVAVHPDDAFARLLISILSITLVFKCAEIVKFWFEARVQSRYIVWTETAALLVVTATKIWMIVSGATLQMFAWVTLAESVAIGAGLVWLYANTADAPRHWRVNLSQARRMVGESWPLMLSGLAVMLYMRVDQIMLNSLAGVHQVGIYTAALRLSEVWYFIPMVISASTFPAIVKMKTDDSAQYHARLQRLLDWATTLSFAVAVVTTCLAPWMIAVLYGTSYAESAIILSLHIWTGVFVALGVCSSGWYLVEGIQRLAFYRTLVGCAVNIVLNFALIPDHGAVGAAVATLTSQACAAYFFDAITPKTRGMFRMKSRALVYSLTIPWRLRVKFSSKNI